MYSGPSVCFKIALFVWNFRCLARCTAGPDRNFRCLARCKAGPHLVAGQGDVQLGAANVEHSLVIHYKILRDSVMRHFKFNFGQRKLSRQRRLGKVATSSSRWYKAVCGSCARMLWSMDSNYLFKDLVKGTVSWDGRGMLLYILRKLLKNAIAYHGKNVILLKGQVTMSHLKDSAMYQVLYSK